MRAKADASNRRHHFRHPKNQPPKKPRTKHRRFFESNQDVKVGPFAVRVKARYPVRTFFKHLSLHFTLHPSKQKQKPKPFHIPSHPIDISSNQRRTSASHRTIPPETTPKRRWFHLP